MDSHFAAKIATKPLVSFPKDVFENIDLLSIEKVRGKGEAKVFGSSNLRIQKYYADIDLHEMYTKGRTKQEVIDFVEDRLVEITKDLEDTEHHFFIDSKIGIDERYEVDVGELLDGVYTPAKNIVRISRHMYNKGLLDTGELDQIIATLHDEPLNADSYETIYSIFREHKVLRWSAKEIINRLKKLPGGETITLNRALTYNAHVKIDTIALIDDRFMEVTNFYLLGYTKHGKVIPINTSYDFSNIDEINATIHKQLAEEIEKLLYSNKYYSPFKAVKRIFALGKNLKDKKVINRVSKFVTGDISLLYQVKSDIGTIVAILENFDVDAEDSKIIQTQIETMKSRVSNVIFVSDRDLVDFSVLADNARDDVDTLKNLAAMEDILKKYINNYTIKFLVDNGFNPPPRNYLPKPTSYEIYDLADKL